VTDDAEGIDGDLPDWGDWGNSSYYEQLGQFVSFFTFAEEAIRVLLVKLSGVRGSKAVALFSGVRVDQGIDFIRRCYRAESKPVPASLTKVFEHLKTLTNYRNDLLHYGIESSNEEMSAPLFVSNRRWVLDHTKARAATVDSEGLWGATLDVSRIAFVLMMHLNLDGDDAPEFARMIEDELERPWRFTNRAPAIQRSAPRTEPQSARPPAQRPPSKA
jgi:hypothetical protein